jgi:hypothetical protein
MSISIEMVVPGLLGYWIDRRIDTLPLLTVLGFGGGLTLGMYHLLKMTRTLPREWKSRERKKRGG